MYASIGSISHGTLRIGDLLEAFSDTLAELDPDEIEAEMIQDARDLLDRDGEAQAEAEYLVNEDLYEALQEHAPPYCYFGTLPGDSSDFGFWPDMDIIEEDRKFGALPDIDSLPEYAVNVNDRGNMTLLRFDGQEYKVVWAVV